MLPDLSRALSLPPPTAAAWARRAWAGVTPRSAGVVLALCAVWAASNTVDELLLAWRDLDFSFWLADDVLPEVGCMAAIAAVMGLAIVAVGNLGPQSGARRLGALALAIALSAVVAGALRQAYLELRGTWVQMPPEVYAKTWLVWWTRYALQATLLTVVAELHRGEASSLEALHRAEVERLAFERETAVARLQVLQAQIEPHFLFNALANVRRLYQTDRAAGREMLDNLMRLLDVALPHMREARSCVGRELALVEAYLGVQRVRMGRRLSYAVDVPAPLLGLELPPMMLLTLVENAVQHGLGPRTEGGTVRIAARLDGATLRVDVADDGAGFRAASGAGTGLANIRARLAALHGDAARLELAPNDPRGLVATLRLPAQEASS
jgi:sensor histidine kinase YesM